ncbi:MAG TPA: GNAT family N-acetyltransferase [Anaerolineae bacterium]|nr:GNAT family N-acetyltransferase [Anaerolineae bacterium]HQH39804.1 GNAT family N-acetyltransferase [Anaerolineae bacterium]
MRFALIHRDFLRSVPTAKFPRRQSYFRLAHRGKPKAKPSLPQGFYIAPVDVVREWTTHPVFDQDLWIWIIDTQTDLPVALGIAEIDRDIAEGALEWIQVLPDYRGRGLGKALVKKLLFRLHNRAAFTTVAGEMNNQSNPEALYRSCGFAGSDLWWMLSA